MSNHPYYIDGYSMGVYDGLKSKDYFVWQSITSQFTLGYADGYQRGKDIADNLRSAKINLSIHLSRKSNPKVFYSPSAEERSDDSAGSHLRENSDGNDKRRSLGKDD